MTRLFAAAGKSADGGGGEEKSLEKPVFSRLTGAKGVGLQEAAEELHEIPSYSALLEEAETEQRQRKQQNPAAAELAFAAFEASVGRCAKEAGGRLKAKRSGGVRLMEARKFGLVEGDSMAELAFSFDSVGSLAILHFGRLQDAVPLYAAAAAEGDSSREARLTAKRQGEKGGFVALGEWPLVEEPERSRRLLKQKEWNEALTRNPQQEAIWMEYLDAATDSEGGAATSRSRLERKLAICAKALASNPYSSCLMLRYLEIYSKLEDSRKYYEKFSDFLGLIGGISKIDSLQIKEIYLKKTLHLKCLGFVEWTASAAKLLGQSSCQKEKLRMQLVCCGGIYSAGYRERSLLILLSQVEIILGWIAGYREISVSCISRFQDKMKFQETVDLDEMQVDGHFKGDLAQLKGNCRAENFYRIWRWFKAEEIAGFSCKMLFRQAEEDPFSRVDWSDIEPFLVDRPIDLDEWKKEFEALWSCIKFLLNLLLMAGGSADEIDDAAGYGFEAAMEQLLPPLFQGKKEEKNKEILVEMTEFLREKVGETLEQLPLEQKEEKRKELNEIHEFLALFLIHLEFSFAAAHARPMAGAIKAAKKILQKSESPCIWMGFCVFSFFYEKNLISNYKKFSKQARDFPDLGKEKIINFHLKIAEICIFQYGEENEALQCLLAMMPGVAENASMSTGEGPVIILKLKKFLYGLISQIDSAEKLGESTCIIKSYLLLQFLLKDFDSMMHEFVKVNHVLLANLGKYANLEENFHICILVVQIAYYKYFISKKMENGRILDYKIFYSFLNDALKKFPFSKDLLQIEKMAAGWSMLMKRDMKYRIANTCKEFGTLRLMRHFGSIADQRIDYEYKQNVRMFSSDIFIIKNLYIFAIKHVGQNAGEGPLNYKEGLWLELFCWLQKHPEAANEIEKKKLIYEAIQEQRSSKGRNIP